MSAFCKQEAEDILIGTEVLLFINLIVPYQFHQFKFLCMVRPGFHGRPRNCVAQPSIITSGIDAPFHCIYFPLVTCEVHFTDEGMVKVVDQCQWFDCRGKQ